PRRKQLHALPPRRLTGAQRESGHRQGQDSQRQDRATAESSFHRAQLPATRPVSAGPAGTISGANELLMMNRRLPFWLPVAAICLGCETLPEAPCSLALAELGMSYLVQLRPQETLPSVCPQGQQYQVMVASQYFELGTDAPSRVVFQPLGSGVPDGGSQALGEFTTLRTPPSSDVCTVETLTPATDDSATPLNSSQDLVPTTYRFSEMQVLSDAAHSGNQFQAKATVDYDIPGCTGLKFEAQGVSPTRTCLNDLICL